MEREIWQLLIMTLIGTLGEALSDPTDDKINGYGLKLEPRYSDILRLKRGTRGNDEEGADVCSSQQLNMLNKMYTECNKKADSPMELALNSKKEFDVFAVFCQAIRSKVGCINTHWPACFKPDVVDQERRQYLDGEVEAAKNNSLLGQGFLNSCPELRNYLSGLVQLSTGANKCSYSQLVDWVGLKDICLIGVRTNFDSQLMLIVDILQKSFVTENKLRQIYQAYCNFRLRWFGCLERTIFRCMSEDKITEVMATVLQDFKKVEKDLKAEEIGFSFNDCPKYQGN